MASFVQFQPWRIKGLKVYRLHLHFELDLTCGQAANETIQALSALQIILVSNDHKCKGPLHSWIVHGDNWRVWDLWKAYALQL